VFRGEAGTQDQTKLVGKLGNISTNTRKKGSKQRAYKLSDFTRAGKQSCSCGSGTTLGRREHPERRCSKKDKGQRESN